MPWTAADATKHTKKATTDKLRKQWAAVANAARTKCIDDRGDTKECDASAIQKANGALAKEVGEMADLQEALTKKVAGHNLKSSDFLVVEDKEKTTTWHLPVKVGGKPDRKLAAAAWAALFSEGGHRGNKYEGPKASSAKSKLKAIYKSEDWDEPASEADVQAQANLCEVSLAEFFGYDVAERPLYRSTGAITFADLDAEREVEDSIQEIRNDTSDLWRMVDNVMWRETITDKVGALRSLFDEYLVRIQEHLGEESSPESETEEPPSVGEMDAPGSVDLAEQAAALSITEATIDDLAQFDALLAEQRVELANPRRAPVMVDFAIIRPGHGNQKDKNYYPGDMLGSDATRQVFEGADIHVTNHGEPTEENKVGKFKTIHGLTEQGLVGTAILYGPDQAEKARNRADADELGTLHCSIRAGGTGKKATVDGQEVTVIESINKVHSVDLVSKAGAGGHAIALKESDGGTSMDEKEKDKNEEPLAEGQPEKTPVEEVEIRESDAPESTEETPAAEGDVTTVTPPTVLSEEAASTLLKESGLDEKAQQWLTGKTYKDEESLKQAIAEMNVFISELVPAAGQPFALGETAAAETVDLPKVLTLEERRERAMEHTRETLAEIEPTYHL